MNVPISLSPFKNKMLSVLRLTVCATANHLSSFNLPLTFLCSHKNYYVFWKLLKCFAYSFHTKVSLSTDLTTFALLSRRPIHHSA
jgi:hypothetical protein